MAWHSVVSCFPGKYGDKVEKPVFIFWHNGGGFDFMDAIADLKTGGGFVCRT
jgi:hypothetical protein